MTNMKTTIPMASFVSQFLAILLLLISIASFCHGGITSSFIRSPKKSEDMPIGAFNRPKGYNTPEQVHITQGDHDGTSVIISWTTQEKKHPDVVIYWKSVYGNRKCYEKNKLKAHSVTSTYQYHTYTSGFIHHATLTGLEHNTEYIYVLGHGRHGRRFFSFKTPPAVGPDVPITFGIIGDLGQTVDSNSTLEHYIANPIKGDAVLFVGDLSYADDHNHDNMRWDTFGRFIEKSAAYQPWIWTAGNHEIDFAPWLGEYDTFKPYTNRYNVPYGASGSNSPLWYSIKRASTYIIVLSTYSSYEKYTPQYIWLQNELSKVDRTQTPWLIILMHTPLYNSNHYHYMEGESMRVKFEPWFVQNKVDLVLAGHVHSYERTERISNIQYNITNGVSKPIKDQSAPIYMTIGDGGNCEGIANNFIFPQPDYSAFREASFGHATLEIKNRTHAYYSWHRNQDGVAVTADSLWINNRYWNPVAETSN